MCTKVENSFSCHTGGSMSILKSERDEIRLLKAKGLSQRKIAWMTGHSRNTVADVLGTLADDDSQRHKPQIQAEVGGRDAGEVPGLWAEGHDAMSRLPGPQLLATKASDQRANAGGADRSAAAAGHQLRGPDRARYQEVHDRKIQRGRIPWDR